MIDFLKEAAGVVPSKRQLAWFDTGFYAFMHFGVNTYTDREWETGRKTRASSIRRSWTAASGPGQCGKPG